MSASRRWADVEVGTALPTTTIPVQRLNLVKYAGASGDFNPIHWDERFAQAVGLPDVIAHGMLTMGSAARVLTDWAGDPGAVVEYGCRMSKPVVVPPGADGTALTVNGTVTDKLDGNRVAVDLEVRCGEDAVLSRTRAVVQLA